MKWKSAKGFLVSSCRQKTSLSFRRSHWNSLVPRLSPPQALSSSPRREPGNVPMKDQECDHVTWVSNTYKSISFLFCALHSCRTSSSSRISLRVQSCSVCMLVCTCTGVCVFMCVCVWVSMRWNGVVVWVPYNVYSYSWYVSAYMYVYRLYTFPERTDILINAHQQSWR